MIGFASQVTLGGTLCAGGAARHRLCASLAALAMTTAGSLLVPAVQAAEFTAANEAELRNAIAAAAASTDPSSTITLTAPITVSNTPFVDLNGKSVTVIANGTNTLSGVDGTNPGSSIVFAPADPGSALTIVGNVQGGDALAGAFGGDGLRLNGVTLTNNGTIVGGAVGGGSSNQFTFGGGGDGRGVFLVNGTLVNNGQITGGSALPTGGTNGVGAVLDGGVNHVNNGTIRGGTTANLTGQWGVDMRNTNLTNNGTILGGAGGSANTDGLIIRETGTFVNNASGQVLGGAGSATTRGGDGLSLMGNFNVTITNHGTIAGGDNTTVNQASFGITSTLQSSGTVHVINDGTISGGSNAVGIGNAFQMLNGRLILELHRGSVIEGVVNAQAPVTNDVLRLGGDIDLGDQECPVSDPSCTFNVGLIGAGRQYRNINIFEKTGTDTWTITGIGDGQVAPWGIYAGTMVMAAGSDLGNGVVDIFGGTLAGVGTVGPTTHHAAGIIAPGINGIGTLTIDGAHTGNGGLLAIETELGDDNSPTDLLAINGGTTGNTFVRVTNLGGTGAQTQDGIKIVDFNADNSGAESSAGTFILLGDLVLNGQQAVLGGAYAYSLFQGTPTEDDGDWYLRSIGFTPSATAYESYPGILLGLIDMPTWQQRVGNIYMPNAGSATDGYVNPEPTADVAQSEPTPANFWTRIEAATGHYEGDSDTGTEYDLDRYKVQVGIDGRLGESEDGIFVAGINAQYGNAKADLESDTGDGENSTDSYGGGLTLTWVGVTGFYADAQAMVHYLESDLSSDVVGDLVENNEGWGYGLSLEVGRKIALDDAVSLTPQAQLYYTSVDFDDFTDELGVDVSLDEGESLKGRLGLALGFDSYDSGDSRGHVYAIANVTYEFLNAQSVDVAGVDVEFEPEDWGGELGLGGTYEWAGGTYSLHGEALGQTSFEGSYGMKGTAGFSVRF